jgi:hypothetical protein
MGIDTMNVRDWGARIIILIYMAVVCVAAVVAQQLMGRGGNSTSGAPQAVFRPTLPYQPALWRRSFERNLT